MKKKKKDRETGRLTRSGGGPVRRVWGEREAVPSRLLRSFTASAGGGRVPCRLHEPSKGPRWRRRSSSAPDLRGWHRGCMAVSRGAGVNSSSPFRPACSIPWQRRRSREIHMFLNVGWPRSFPASLPPDRCYPPATKESRKATVRAVTWATGRPSPRLVLAQTVSGWASNASGKRVLVISWKPCPAGCVSWVNSRNTISRIGL